MDNLKKRKKISLHDLLNMKKMNKNAVYITAYDYPLARLADRAGVDMVLIGDSLAMTTLGYETTIPVSMDEMISHAQAVRRAVKYSFLIGDMPFLSYQPSDRDAIMNAGRFITAGCDGVKCEGGKRVTSRIRAMVDAGILVQGHLGLTPQNMAQFGGYKVQGTTLESYSHLLEDAFALQEAGVWSILLEAIPSPVAGKIRSQLSIPVYGIGAGKEVDGQLLIIHDIIGLFDAFKPKFAKRYCEVGNIIYESLTQYTHEVREGTFPQPEYFYDISQEELQKILNS